MVQVILAVIPAFALILVAFVSFILNRRMTIEADWRKKKLEYYEYFFDSLAQITEGDSTPESHYEFARSSNDLLLIAPADVLSAHHAFRQHISLSNQSRDYEQDNVLLAALINAIRADLKIADLCPISTDDVQLWSSKAQPIKARAVGDRRPMQRRPRSVTMVDAR